MDIDVIVSVLGRVPEDWGNLTLAEVVGICNALGVSADDLIAFLGIE